jgi:phosphosulfolactate synthase
MEFGEFTSVLGLPEREGKPRSQGVTMVIDTGLPLGYLTDLVASHGQHIDFVKFGWGTSLVTQDIHAKIDVLRESEINWYFGGSLFEKSLVHDRFEEFRALCYSVGASFVEVSNGTVDLSDGDKVGYVEELAQDFVVISEVGLKDQARSDVMYPAEWIKCINADLDAGARYVTLETRESGHAGLCRSNGELRIGLVEEILTSGVDVNRLIFEAPSNYLQNFFVQRVGPRVNLGNIAASDVIGLETIRRGLRSETLVAFATMTSPLPRARPHATRGEGGAG